MKNVLNTAVFQSPCSWKGPTSRPEPIHGHTNLWQSGPHSKGWGLGELLNTRTYQDHPTGRQKHIDRLTTDKARAATTLGWEASAALLSCTNVEIRWARLWARLLHKFEMDTNLVMKIMVGSCANIGTITLWFSTCFQHFVDLKTCRKPRSQPSAHLPGPAFLGQVTGSFWATVTLCLVDFQFPSLLCSTVDSYFSIQYDRIIEQVIQLISIINHSEPL